MNLSDISTKARKLVRVSSNSWPNNELLIDLNITLDNIGTLILGSQDEADFDDTNYPDFPIKYDDLVAGQQMYNYPSRLLDIKRMELALDGSNWRKAQPIDIAEIDSHTEDNVNNLFNTETPYYDMQYGFFFLYPVPQVDVTAGIKIWISRNVKSFELAELVAGTVEPGFDRPFHLMLSIGAAYEFAKTNRLDVQEVLKRDWDEMAVRLRKHYGNKNKDRHWQLKPAYVDYV